MRKYVIGKLLDPRPDDAVYLKAEEAIRWAREWASQDRKQVIAMWQRVDDSQSLMRVFVACEELTPFPFCSTQ